MRDIDHLSDVAAGRPFRRPAGRHISDFTDAEMIEAGVKPETIALIRARFPDGDPHPRASKPKPRL